MKRKRQLKWRQVDGYAEETECARYTMAAAKVMGVWKFQGWRRPVFSEAMATLLGTRSIAQDARDLCELDVASQQKAA